MQVIIDGDRYTHRSVNLGDVTDASPEAQVWLAGFLSG